MACDIVFLDAAQVDRVEPLWRAMVEHHRLVAGAEWPVRDAAEAWRARRRQYASWLHAPEPDARSAWLLAATTGGDAAPLLGYAMLRLASGPTWDFERLGEVESLAVAPSARGRGVGTALLEQCRRVLGQQGVDHWSVGVVEANADAIRLYGRFGFRPFYRQLLGRIEPEGGIE